MSRIHEALRRGGAAATPSPGRGARADAVLATLGYQAERRAVSSRALGSILLVVLIAAAAWAMWTGIRGARLEFRDPTPEVRGSRFEARGSGTGIEAAPAPQLSPAVSIPSRASAIVVQPTPSIPPAPKPAAPKQVAASPTQPTQQPQNESRVSSLEPRASSLEPRAPDPFQLALYHQRAGDFEQALLNYKAALQRDEMNLEAHNNLGYLYLGKGRLEEAAREFQRVIAIEPKYVTAHVNLSATFYRQNRFDAAAAQAREAIGIDPRNGDALVNLAVAQKASGQQGDAQGSLRRAIELNPGSAAAHYNLARQYEESGEAARAIDHYRLFLQYAGPEQSDYARDVRQRLPGLTARIR